MGATQQMDHAGVAQATLPAQFKDSAALKALLQDLVGRAALPTWGLQELEQVLFDVRDQRWLATAAGQQLDNLGAIVGEPRCASSDADYRDAIRVRIEINCSQGEPARLIRLLLAITGATGAHLMEKEPARLKLVAIEHLRTYALDRLHSAVSAGVALSVQSSPSATPFIYGRARDAAGNLGTTQQHPHGGLGYGVCGAPGTGGLYSALWYEG